MTISYDELTPLGMDRVYSFPEGCALFRASFMSDEGMYTAPVILWGDNRGMFAPAHNLGYPPDFSPEDVPLIEWVDLETRRPAHMFRGLPYRSPY